MEMIRLLPEVSFGVGDPEVVGLLPVFVFFFGNFKNRECRRGRRDLK
jgi:hypothetical protein